LQANTKQFFEAFDDRERNERRIRGRGKLFERGRHASETLAIVCTEQHVGLVERQAPQQDRTVLQHCTVALELCRAAHFPVADAQVCSLLTGEAHGTGGAAPVRNARFDA
jgi:hypothetical protein